jgi:hypothetical protein
MQAKRSIELDKYQVKKNLSSMAFFFIRPLPKIIVAEVQ